MTAIDKEQTIEAIKVFKERFIDCKMRDYDKGFVDGLDYCIRYIDKFAPEASQIAQIAFDFSGEND